MRRVFSLTPYFGEDDVLEIKVAEQAPYVDVFCLIEATTDHQGKPRSLTWSEPSRVHELAAQHKAEIRYDSITFPPGMQPWEREGFQRASLSELADDVAPADLIIISDLDEVLRGSMIFELREREYTLPAQIAFPIHPYRLDWQWTLPVEIGWCLCTAVNGQQLMEWGAQRAVKEAHKYTQLTGPQYGWHFTYQGDAAWIVNKARSIADGWTGELANLYRAQLAIAEGADLFGRERPVRAVPMNELPFHVQANQARFMHLLRGGSDGQEEVRP